MRFILGHALWLVAFLILFYTSGALLCRFGRREQRDSGERWLLRIAFGAAAWMGIVFVLALFGLLQPVLLWAAALMVLGVGAVRALRDVVALATKPQAPPPQSVASGLRRHRLPSALLLAALAAVTAVLFFQALRPNVAWDANVYHLTVPRLYLEHGGFVRIPWNVYSNWPLATQLLYGMAMALGDYLVAHTLHLAFGLLCAALVARLVWRAGGETSRWAGWLAAALFLANPVVLYEIRVAYVDLAYAFFLGVAFLLLQRALEAEGAPSRRDSNLLLCGVACGVLAGIKLNGFFGLLALGGLYVLETWRGADAAATAATDRLRRIARGLVLLGLPALLLLLPWLLKSYLLTGNPVYPFFYDVLGGGEWSEGLARQHAAWQRSIGMGRAPLDYLLLPLRVILFGDFGYHRFDGAVSPLWLAWLVLALWGSDRLGRRALWVALFYFLFWGATSQQARLLIPVLPLLAVATGRAAARLTSRLGERRIRRFVEVGLAGLVAGALVQASWIYLVQTPRLVRDLWRHGDALKAVVVHPVYGFIEWELPQHARLLMVNHNHGFFVTRPYLADSFFEASQVAERFATQKSEAEVVETLDELGVTHVLVERRERGLRLAGAFLQFLADPERVREVYRSEDGRFIVLRVL